MLSADCWKSGTQLEYFSGSLSRIAPILGHHDVPKSESNVAPAYTSITRISTGWSQIRKVSHKVGNIRYERIVYHLCVGQ